MSRKRINIGQITGNGKERSAQSMSGLLEKILDKKNMNEAYKKVCANKGAGGVDGMEVEGLDGYIRKNWDSIRDQIRERSYRPQPVRRVEIPKPNGSKRNLGIPTAMDRVIQQGIAQIISPMCEPLLSDHSYGFRPGRSCEMAIRDMLMFLNEGYEWIVDIDLEKFFDNVPQDKLMSLVHNIINDGDTVLFCKLEETGFRRLFEVDPLTISMYTAHYLLPKLHIIRTSFRLFYTKTQAGFPACTDQCP